MTKINIRRKIPADDIWVKDILKKHWGSSSIVTRGKITKADKIPGFIAVINSQPVGLITYNISQNDLEIITLNSEKEGIGVGTALINELINVGKKGKCKRIWVITTNDNQAAINFYQKMGFSLKAIYENALEESRKLKPEIPLLGIGGMPIKDELEFERVLN